MAGSDNNSVTLDGTFSQKSFFVNMIGAMTAVTTPGLSNGFRCQTDAGTATVQINKNGTTGNLSGTLVCTTSMGANLPTGWTTPTIDLNEVLDFRITAFDGTAKRVTVCIATMVGP